MDISRLFAFIYDVYALPICSSLVHDMAFLEAVI